MSAADLGAPPPEPSECRRHAAAALEDGAPLFAVAWALLAIAADLAAIRRSLSKGR